MPAKKVITLEDVQELELRTGEVLLLVLKRRHSKSKDVAARADKQFDTIKLYLRVLDRGIREFLKVADDVSDADLHRRFPPDTVLTDPRISAAYQGLTTALRHVVR